jgi:hypothetical protein
MTDVKKYFSIHYFIIGLIIFQTYMMYYEHKKLLEAEREERS